MPSTTTVRGVMGKQAAFIPGVKPPEQAILKHARLLLQYNEGLIDKSLDAQVLAFLAEYTDLYAFIDPTRHAEFTRWWVNDKPNIKTICNRLQDAARAIEAQQRAERQGGRGW